MNKLLTVLLLGGLALLPAAYADDPLPRGQQRVVVPVEGMTCGGCVATIKIAVKKLNGIVKVDADHKKGTATVVYEQDKIDVSQIVEAINKCGFKASPPETRPEHDKG